MRVVVTGGAGFIGANLCRALLATPGIDHVVALDDLSAGKRENLQAAPGVELVEASILDRAALNSAFRGAQAVVHLAARPSISSSIVDPRATHHANATGTLEVLEAVRSAGHPHLVMASSSAVYGADPELPAREDRRPMPVSPYAASKLAGEAYARAYAACFGLELMVFRLFNVFGPLQPSDHRHAGVVPAFVSAALAGHPLIVHGDGRQTRDFTFIDTVTLVLAAAVAGRVHEPDPVNLAFGTRTSLLELAATLEDLLGRPLPRDHRGSRLGDAHDSQADVTRLRHLFPDVRPVDLRTGLSATVDWFRTRAPHRSELDARRGTDGAFVALPRVVVAAPTATYSEEASDHQQARPGRRRPESACRSIGEVVDIVALTAFLAPFLPALLKPAQDAAADLAERFGGAAVEQAKVLWGRLRGKVESRPSAQEAAEDVASKPDDADALAALQWQLKKIVAEDPAFAQELSQAWEQAKQAAGISVTVTASGERSVAIGGSAYGPISTGDTKPPSL